MPLFKVYAERNDSAAQIKEYVGTFQAESHVEAVTKAIRAKNRNIYDEETYFAMPVK